MLLTTRRVFVQGEQKVSAVIEKHRLLVEALESGDKCSIQRWSPHRISKILGRTIVMKALIPNSSWVTHRCVLGCAIISIVNDCGFNLSTSIQNAILFHILSTIKAIHTFRQVPSVNSCYTLNCPTIISLVSVIYRK